ncbi:hypothetical protein F4805DRAFT_429984 [Annulohypoxylon moriforme]|nr:hypothetical protein F4805DRAFT_429984 [Annulohypoxylon moriforme]
MSDGLCGGSKNALTSHFDRQGSREAYNVARRRADEEYDQREWEEILMRDSVRYDEHFASFQHASVLPLLPRPATNLNPTTSPRSIHPINSPPRLAMSNGHRHQHLSPPGSIDRAFPTQPTQQDHSTHQSWVGQFQDQQQSSNIVHSSGSRSTNGRINHGYSAPMYGAPTQVSMAPVAPMPAFPATPMHQEPALAAPKMNPTVEFDNAYKEWVINMGTDEAHLWSDASAPNQAPAPTQASAPVLESKAPVASPTTEPIRPEQKAENRTEHAQNSEDTKLAIAAQEIINSVSEDNSAKFQQSEFISLMRKIASMNLVVRDNELVNPDTLLPETASSSSGASTVKPKPATVEDEE